MTRIYLILLSSTKSDNPKNTQSSHARTPVRARTRVRVRRLAVACDAVVVGAVLLRVRIFCAGLVALGVSPHDNALPVAGVPPVACREAISLLRGFFGNSPP